MNDVLLGAASDSASSATGTRSRARVRYNAALKLVRRAHMFAGLFLTPWVFLYGITGFLFNHPYAFPDVDLRHAGREDVASTALGGFPTAPELSVRLVEALNADAGTPQSRLVDRDREVYSRAIVVAATGGGYEHSVRLDPDSGEAFIRSTVREEPDAPPSPFAKVNVAADPPLRKLPSGALELLAKLGIEAQSAAMRNPPDLLCTVERDGRHWRLTYNLQSGELRARPADAPSSRLATRQFLTGLHLAYKYPSRWDVRWLWAVAVDAMSVTMVFWGVSGLLMWWQMKKLRSWGLAVIVLSLVAAAAIAAGMHTVLAAKV
jgi:hypothetical protein